jgi:hypothetical protein
MFSKVQDICGVGVKCLFVNLFTFLILILFLTILAIVHIYSVSDLMSIFSFPFWEDRRHLKNSLFSFLDG